MFSAFKSSRLSNIHPDSRHTRALFHCRFFLQLSYTISRFSIFILSTFFFLPLSFSPSLSSYFSIFNNTVQRDIRKLKSATKPRSTAYILHPLLSIFTEILRYIYTELLPFSPQSFSLFSSLSFSRKAETAEAFTVITYSINDIFLFIFLSAYLCIYFSFIILTFILFVLLTSG